MIGLCLVMAVTTAPSMVEADAVTASIYGRVVDLFGTPITDAVVEVTPIQTSQKVSVRTDKDGRYLFRDVLPGEVSLVVKSQGFRVESETLVVHAAEQLLLDFGLEPGSIADQPPVELSGMVQQASKAPIKDATVTVVNAFNRRLIRTVRTDGHGHYRVEFRNGGQFLVYAFKPGFLVSTASVVLPAAMPRGRKIDLTLIPVSRSVYGVFR